MSDFKVGDRVEVIVHKEYLSANPHIKEGMLGTIIDIDDDDDGLNIGVQFDNYIQGHAANGKGKSGFCWFMYEENIKKSEKKEVKEKI
jgi:hypothetical protein